VFDYETYTQFNTIALVTASQSSLKARAQVLVSRLSTCQYELRLRNASCSAWTTDQLDYLNRFPIRFGLSFGRVQQLCISDQDVDWSLNIKRALISHLQLYWPPPDIRTNRSGIVRTIHGECPFEYQSIVSNSTDRHVRLHIPLQKCDNRLASIGSMQVHGQSGHFRLPSGLLVQGASLQCKLTLNADQLRDVACIEQSSISPLLGSQLSSNVIVRSRLIWLQQQSYHPESSVTVTFGQSSGVLFEPIRDPVTSTATIDTIGHVESIEHIRLVRRHLRQLPPSTLCPFIDARRNESTRQSIVIDQMLQLGTAESFVCARQLIQQNRLQSVQRRTLYSAIAWAAEPTEQGLRSLQDLHSILLSRLSTLEMRSLLLSISGYTNNLQKSLPKSDGIQDTVTQLSRQLMDTLTLTCDQESDASVLKALVPMASSLNVEHRQKLLLCFVNATGVEQQLLALDVMAANREAESIDLHNLFVQIFADDRHDLEVRLAIFRYLIQETRYQDMLFEVTKQSTDQQRKNQVHFKLF
jgi:hypothetical protein